MVGYVQVTTKYHWLILILLEPLQVIVEICIPLLYAVIQSLKSFSSVWHICSHEYEPLEFNCDRPAFSSVLLAEIKLNRDWLHFGKDSSA